MTKKIYTYEDLSEKAKKNAIEQHRGINVDYHQWWHTIGDEAKSFGIEIIDFDLGQSKLDLEFSRTRDDICSRIIDELDEEHDLGYIARHFTNASLGCTTKAFQRAFRTAVEYYYLEALKKEWEWHTCDANVEDTVQNMDVRYYENGTISEET